MDNPGLHRLALDLLTQSDDFRTAQIQSMQHLAGDASTRSYIRLQLLNAPQESVIMMRLASSKGPWKDGKVLQDDSFVEVGHFLYRNAIPVPRILVDARPRKLLIVEDVGDLALWNFARGELDERGQKLLEGLRGDGVAKLYRRAIDVIGELQAIKPDDTCLAFKRTVRFEQFRSEVAEFSDYYLGGKLPHPALKIFDELYDALCESVASHPQSLSHFDCMSHNVYVNEAGEIRLIDFQDAGMTSCARDLVALINDRDIDTALGKERHARLLRYYLETVAWHDDFLRFYDEMLLHWDLRVAGRFVQLSDLHRREQYRLWVPGTLRRLGRTMFRLQGSLPRLEDIIDILLNHSPDFEEGFQDAWDLNEAR